MAGTTLHDFEDVEPLRVREKKAIIANGGVVGYAGPSNRDENVVVVHKRRYKDDNGEQDYFRKLKAYNFDETALTAIENIGTTLIVINEIDNNRLIEYQLSQFKDSDMTRDWDGFDGINYYVPVSDAIRTWDRESCTINRDH